MLPSVPAAAAEDTVNYYFTSDVRESGNYLLSRSDAGSGGDVSLTNPARWEDAEALTVAAPVQGQPFDFTLFFRDIGGTATANLGYGLGDVDHPLGTTTVSILNAQKLGLDGVGRADGSVTIGEDIPADAVMWVELSTSAGTALITENSLIAPEYESTASSPSLNCGRPPSWARGSSLSSASRASAAAEAEASS